MQELSYLASEVWAENTKFDTGNPSIPCKTMEIPDKNIYTMGETITAIGLFITIIGLLTMIYSYTPDEKIDILPV